MTTSDTTLAARLSGVSKLYGTGNTAVRALDSVDFEVRGGEMLLLVGPSGCGKTTLLSVLAGIMDATSGVIDVFGNRVDRMSQAEKTRFRRDNIGFIFQQYNLLPTLTATENVAIPLLIHKQPWEVAMKKARTCLELVGLESRTEFLPGNLSGGQQQRVAIARALITEPRLIVCDEPTASLDGDTGKHIMEMFRNTALAAGRAIVVVTHDSRIFSYGDRIAEMLDGRITGIHAQPEEAA